MGAQNSYSATQIKFTFVSVELQMRTKYFKTVTPNDKAKLTIKIHNSDFAACSGPSQISKETHSGNTKLIKQTMKKVYPRYHPKAFHE